MMAKITGCGLFSLVIIFIMSSSCTFTRVAKERYSLPSLPSYLDDDQKVIMLALTGPFEGALLSQVVTVPNDSGGYSLDVKTGGLPGLDGHLDILKEKYHSGLLTIAAGHFSSSSLSKSDVERVITFYRDHKYSAILLNAEDFNTLNKYHLWEKAKDLPFLNANWVNIKTHDSALLPYKIIEKEGLKIAIIGLSLDKNDRPDPKIAPQIIREESVAAYLRVMSALRQQKVDYRILVTDAETTCRPSTGEEDEDNKSCAPSKEDVLANFLKRLPPNSLDMVLTGGPIPYQGKIDNVKVVQNRKGGNILSLKEIYQEGNDSNIISRSLPPVMLCHHFFQATNDCFFEGNFSGKEERTRLLQDSRFEKIPAKFLGFEVKLDSKWQL